MTTDHSEAVLAANMRFYRALANADGPAMDAVWSHKDDVACLHPNWPLLQGWRNVQASWHGIFEQQGPFRVWPSDVTISASGDMAWITCTENVDASDAGQTVGVVIQVQATNIFRRKESDWRMVHHHASQQPQRPLNGPGTLRPSISQN